VLQNPTEADPATSKARVTEKPLFPGIHLHPELGPSSLEATTNDGVTGRSFYRFCLIFSPLDTSGYSLFRYSLELRG
jgi:hypothetical protein